jgi:hypothetical protein
VEKENNINSTTFIYIAIYLFAKQYDIWSDSSLLAIVCFCDFKIS